MKMKRLAGLTSLVMIASMLGTAAIAAVVDPGRPREGGLVEVGPISPETGFPTWYRDSNGIRLEACYTMEDPLCGALPDEIPDPEAPISFPDNFPGEFFYQLANTTVPTSAGPEVLVVMDLEAAFAQEEPRDGDQMVFGRIRIRAKDVPDGQTWRITHPYGVDQFTTDGGGGINMTEDIGTTPQSFGGAMRSRIGPFLRWDPAVAPAAPAGYVGDPGIDHEVVGSPYGTNFVRVERLGPDGNWQTIGETRQFSLQGRLATNSGLDVQSATYSTDGAGNGFLDVLASSESGQVIQVPANSSLGTPTITLRGDGGRYFARIAMPNPPPADDATITVRNVSDNPASTKTIKVVDQVTIERAVYDADARTLTVEATSSDAGAPALSVGQFGAMTSGVATYSNVQVPPAVVTVTSAAGGSAQRAVTITGGAFSAEAPMAAFTGPSNAQVGQRVTFDAGASLGDVTGYSWTITGPGGTTTGSARTIDLPDGRRDLLDPARRLRSRWHQRADDRHARGHRGAGRVGQRRAGPDGQPRHARAARRQRVDGSGDVLLEAAVRTVGEPVRCGHGEAVVHLPADAAADVHGRLGQPWLHRQQRAHRARAHDEGRQRCGGQGHGHGEPAGRVDHRHRREVPHPW